MIITPDNVGDFEYERRMENRLSEKANMAELYREMEEEPPIEEDPGFEEWAQEQIEISKSLSRRNVKC